jgi:hypothetical protein
MHAEFDTLDIQTRRQKGTLQESMLTSSEATCLHNGCVCDGPLLLREKHKLRVSEKEMPSVFVAKKINSRKEEIA